MGVMCFFPFLIYFYVIQWEFHIFSNYWSIFHVIQLQFHIFYYFFNFPCYSIGNLFFFLNFLKFSMLFNGKFSFCQFSMLFNGNLRLENLWGGDGRTDGRTDVRNGSPLCPTGHRPFGAAAQKGDEVLLNTGGLILS